MIPNGIINLIWELRFEVREGGKITQSNSVRAVFEIFSSVFSFCKIKGYY